MLLRTLTFLLLSFFGLSTLSAQLVVAERPTAPERTQELPAPRDESFVLIPAEWAEKRGAYHYVQARYVREQAGKKYVPGKWKKVKGGWMWQTGVWK